MKKYKLKKIFRPDWTKGNNRNKKLLWLDKNENTDELLLNDISKIIKKVDAINYSTYPDLAKLYKKLAKKLQINPKNIMLTAGSDLGIKTVFDSFIEKNDYVLRTNPTFAMYSVYNQVFKTREKIINYKYHDSGPYLAIENIIDKLKKFRFRLVCLPNPDSPTGHTFSDKEINKLLKVAKKRESLVLIDEAYYPFYPSSCLKFIKKYDNLIITRTTSKAWGLAGLRVGYILSSKKLIEEMHKTRPMYEINSLGAEVFFKLLDNYSFVKKSVKRLAQGKNFFKKELIKKGYRVFKKENGNFLHVNFGKDREKIFRGLKNTVYFRKLELHESMKNFSRFSLTTRKNFKKILNIIKKI